MFGPLTLLKAIILTVVGAAIGIGICTWWHHVPAPVPLTEPDKASLKGAGFEPTDEGPIADATPALPGKPAATVHLHSGPRDRGATGTPSPDQATPPPAPIYTDNQVVVAKAPPIPPGLTLADVDCDATIRFRMAGGELWADPTLKVCILGICRTDAKPEVEVQWDRATLCGRPRLPRGGEIRAGAYLGKDSVLGLRLGASGYREAHRLGWWGDLDVGLTASDRTVYQTYSRDGYPGVRSYLETEPRDWRISAGLALRF